MGTMLRVFVGCAAIALFSMAGVSGVEAAGGAKDSGAKAEKSKSKAKKGDKDIGESPATDTPAETKAAEKTPGGLAKINKAQRKREREAEKANQKTYLKELQGYVAANPNAADIVAAYAKLISTAGEVGDSDAAKAAYDVFVEKFNAEEGSAAVKVAYAEVALGAGAPAAAANIVHAAVAATDDNNAKIDLLTGLANAYALTGDIENAKKAYDLVLALDAIKGNPRYAKYFGEQKDGLDGLGKDFNHIEITGLDGTKISTKDLKGKVVLVDFWATWCGPCRAEMPHVLEMYEEYGEKGFEVIGISADSGQTEADVRKFLAENDLPWKHAFDSGSVVLEAHGVTSFPTVILINQEGKVVSMNARGETLTRALKVLFAAKK